MKGCLWAFAIVFVIVAIALISADSGNSPSRNSSAAPRPVSPAVAARRDAEAGLRWTSRQSTSRIDDSPSVYLQLRAVELATNEYGRRVQPVLHIRCYENTTTLYIDVPDTFLDTESVRVTYRLDDQPARQADWRVSTDYGSMGLWRGNQSIPLIRQLAGADLLTVRFTPYGNVPFQTTFMVEGLDEELPPLREACNW
jgi:type VI secretion system protein VasI